MYALRAPQSCRAGVCAGASLRRGFGVDNCRCCPVLQTRRRASKRKRKSSSAGPRNSTPRLPKSSGCAAKTRKRAVRRCGARACVAVVSQHRTGAHDCAQTLWSGSCHGSVSAPSTDSSPSANAPLCVPTCHGICGCKKSASEWVRAAERSTCRYCVLNSRALCRRCADALGAEFNRIESDTAALRANMQSFAAMMRAQQEPVRLQTDRIRRETELIREGTEARRRGTTCHVAAHARVAAQ